MTEPLEYHITTTLDPYEQGIVIRALKIAQALAKIDAGECTDINDPDHAGILEMQDRTAALQARLELLEQQMAARLSETDYPRERLASGF